MSGATTDRSGFRSDIDFTSLIVIAGITAVVFAGGLSLFGWYEIPPDIDFKPFFVVYAVIMLVPWGTPTLASAVGATAAEGILDLVEGYEPDEPFGWAGFILGFTLFGWLTKDADHSDWLRVSVAATVAAFLQMAVEGLAFLVIENEAIGFYAYVVSANTLTHGVVMGALLLIPTLNALEGRVQQFLGSASKAQASAD